MSDDLEIRIVDFVNEVLTLADLDLKAKSEETSEGFRVQIRGADLSILLSRNAELLDALEYLANRAFQRDSNLEHRIVFDCGTYRAQREKELKLMAEKAAEKVRTTRVPFSFDPMTPNERRIIHLALVEDNSVKTESRGDGIDRKVTIYPA
jgi:spoIIIJ-associated protein